MRKHIVWQTEGKFFVDGLGRQTLAIMDPEDLQFWFMKYTIDDVEGKDAILKIEVKEHGR